MESRPKRQITKSFKNVFCPYILILMVFSIARWQEQYNKSGMIAIMTTVTKLTLDCYLYVTEYSLKDDRCVSGIYGDLLWEFGILPVGVVICTRAVDHEHDEFRTRDLSVAVPWRERLAR